MAKVTSRKQLKIWECKTEDGGVGLQFGDGAVHMGYDESDLMRLLAQVFDLPESPSFIDADFHDLAHAYLDETAAQERFAELRGEW